MKPAGWDAHVRGNRRAYVRFRGWHARVAFMLQLRAVTEQG